jgi:P27 family predicted phage terminase small subunit
MKGRKPALAPVEGSRIAGRCPASPSWLSDHAKAEWRRAAPELQGRGLLHPDSIATLESYCVAVGTVRECEARMIEDGRLLTSPDGLMPHPSFRMQMAAMREARLLAAELGLTPHRRGKGETEKKDAGDGWDSDLLA